MTQTSGREQREKAYAAAVPRVVPRPRRPRTENDVERHYRLVKQGDALRASIDAGINMKHMTMADLARQVGMPSASSLYNLRSGQTHSLSIRYSVAISRILGINLTVLMGQPPVAAEEDVSALVLEATRARASPEIKNILNRLAMLVLSGTHSDKSEPQERSAQLEVAYEVNADIKHRRVQILPEAERERVTSFLSERELGRLAFGVRVIGKAGAPLYPPATTLVCVPAKGHMTELVDKRRVVVRLRQDTRVVNTIELRQVRSCNGTRWLDPIGDYGKPIQVPRTIRTADMWHEGDLSVRVIGIVTSAVIPEEGPPAK